MKFVFELSIIRKVIAFWSGRKVGTYPIICKMISLNPRAELSYSLNN